MAFLTNPNLAHLSIVGLIGEAQTDIEAHSASPVLAEGEIWQARSKKNPAGRIVRVLRQDGFWLTVKKVENCMLPCSAMGSHSVPTMSSEK